MVTSGDVPTATPKKPGGVTPTMVKGCPSMRSERPIAAMIPLETPLPGGIAQHRNGLRLGRGIPDVGLIEKAARCRLKAEGVVKRARHEHHRRRLGFARPLGLQGPRRPREHAPEHVRPIAHLLEHGVGERRIRSVTNSPGAATGSGRSRTASTSVKTVVIPPIPQASASTAAHVSPGARRNCRSANRRSRRA